MTKPLAPPKRANPQVRTHPPLLPPAERSRAALALVGPAGRGEFALHRCADCEAVLYPPRDACPRCLSPRIEVRRVEDGGEVIAETTVRISRELYFRERPPVRIGTVRLDAGPSVIAFLHGDVAVGMRAKMLQKLDIAGNAVMMAMPEEETPHMRDDPQYRALTASPRHRRVLVTDGRSPVGPALARALLEAGAAKVFLGLRDPWRGFPERVELDDAVEIVPLDVTDADGLAEAAGAIAGKVDILVNTADHTRPDGGVLGAGIARMVDTFETNVFGLARLAQAFGPSMRARGADGTNNAAAFLDVLPIHALANWPAYAALSASAAARLSLLQALRAELRPGGIRVMALFTGPQEDRWHEEVDPPKVSPAAIARAVVHALEEGLEESFVGDVARDVHERWRTDPKVLERELAR